MTNDTEKVINNEIEAALDQVLSGLEVNEKFASRFRQLVRNAINNNFADGDLRSVIDLAPTEYEEGQ